MCGITNILDGKYLKFCALSTGDESAKHSECLNRHKSGLPEPYWVGDRRIYRAPRELARPQFNASRRAIDQLQVMFQHWFGSRQRSNRPEFNSSMRTKQVASAFEWQRGKEGDEGGRRQAILLLPSQRLAADQNFHRGLG